MTDSEKFHVPPAAVLGGYIQGQWIARCVHLAATLDLADHLKNGPKSIQYLAEATETHAPSLYRLLRALASLGIFTEVEPAVFAQTELSNVLRFDLPGSLGYMAKYQGQEWLLKSWEHLEYSLRTGKAAVEHVYGTDIWTYFSQHPEQDELFNQTMTSFHENFNPLLARSYDFSAFTMLVDIGGGQGTFLETILSDHPELQGILFDLPKVIESTRAKIKPRDRLQLVGGSFFTAIPEGGDAYMMKEVLHDWTDEDCIRILANCRRAMKPESKLLLFETLIQPEGGSETKLRDLLMLVAFSGRERTAEEFASLFEASGFQLTQVIPTGTSMSIVEGIPV